MNLWKIVGRKTCYAIKKARTINSEYLRAKLGNKFDHKMLYQDSGYFIKPVSNSFYFILQIPTYNWTIQYLGSCQNFLQTS
jgi:hypothetical protein